MKCDVYVPLLSAHLDGMNTAEEEKKLQKHLESCESCRELLAQMKENDQLLRCEEIPVPSDLTEKIMGNVRRTKKNKKPFYISLAASGLAAAAVLALAFSGKVSVPTKEEQTQMTQASVQEFELRQPVYRIGKNQETEESEPIFDYAPIAEAPLATETIPFGYAGSVATGGADITKDAIGVQLPVLVIRANEGQLDFDGEKVTLNELKDVLSKAEYTFTGQETAVYLLTWQELERVASVYSGVYEMEKLYEEGKQYLQAVLIFAE